MPIYEYRCDECGASFEVMQRMSDDPLVKCEKCGGALRKVMHPVAIHFKGSGFYTTDYGKGSGRPTSSRDSSPDGGESGGETSGASDGKSGESGGASEGKSGADAQPAKVAKDDGAKEKQKAT